MKRTLLLLTLTFISINSIAQLIYSPPVLEDANSKNFKMIKLDKGTALSENTYSDIDSLSIRFVGDGNLQSSLNDGTDFAATTGLGVIFQRVWLPNSLKNNEKTTSDINIDFSINVASTVDTITALYANDSILNKRQFGTHVLLPSNSGQSVNFRFSQFFKPDKPLFKCWSGWEFNLNASNRIWQDKAESWDITTLSMRAGVFHDFMPNNTRLENQFSIRVGTAATYRGIMGDAGFSSSDAANFRNNLLGTDQRNYYGVEFFGELQFENIRVGVSLPYIFGNHNVLGLSKAQFITSISFIGGFPVKIDRKPSTKPS